MSGMRPGSQWGEGSEDRWSRSEQWKRDAGNYREFDDTTGGKRSQEVQGFGGRVVSVLLCLAGLPVSHWLGSVTHRTSGGWEFLYFMGFIAVVIGVGSAVRWLWDRW